MTHIKALASACLAALIAGGPAAAQSTIVPEPPLGALQLTNIWTRLGDVNGEAGAVEVGVFSPDGRYIATGSKYDDQLILWHTVDGTVAWRHTVEAEVEGIAFSPDSRYMASGGEDLTVRVWRVRDGKQVGDYPADAALDSMAWSHDGRTVAAGEEDTGQVRVYDVSKGARLTLRGIAKHGDTINSIDFASDDSVMVTGGDNGRITVWRVADLSQVRAIQAHDTTIKSVRLNPDDSLILSGAGAGDVALWTLADGALIKRMWEPGYVEAVEFTPDGRFFVTGGHYMALHFYRVSDFLLGMSRREMDNIGQFGMAARFPAYASEYIDFLPSGAMTTVHENGLVHLWLWSSDPAINYRGHRALRERQKATADRIKAGRN